MERLSVKIKESVDKATANKARQPRENPDWPMTVYSYRCWPLTDTKSLPQDVFDILWAMRRLKNEWVARWRDVQEKVTARDENKEYVLSKDERAALLQTISLKTLQQDAKRYSAILSSECRAEVLRRYQIALRHVKQKDDEGSKQKLAKSKKRKELQFQSSFDTFKIPNICSALKFPISEIRTNARVNVWNTLDLKEQKGTEFQNDYYHNGNFRIYSVRRPDEYPAEENGFQVTHSLEIVADTLGWPHRDGTERSQDREPRKRHPVTIPLHVAYHRDLPEEGNVCESALIGRYNHTTGWKYYLQFKVEAPPRKITYAPGAAGIEFGIRQTEKGIRLAVITTSAGEVMEIHLPQDWTNARLARLKERQRQRGLGYAVATSFQDLEDLQNKQDKHLERAKDYLMYLGEEVVATWPDRAQKMYRGRTIKGELRGGILKIRAKGLHKLLGLLVRYSGESEVTEFLRAWEAEQREMHLHWFKANEHWQEFWQQAQRRITHFLFTNFGIVAYNRLKLSKMATSGTEAKEKRKNVAKVKGKQVLRTPEEKANDEMQKWRVRAALYQQYKFIEESYVRPEHDAVIFAPGEVQLHCTECGEPIKRGKELTVTCANGHEYDQDKLASYWNLQAIIGETASTPAKRPEIPTELRKVLARAPVA